MLVPSAIRSADNGVADEGCPAGIATTFQKDLPLLGDSQGGMSFTDDCKDGEVLGGVDATDAPWHGRPASAVLALPPMSALWLEPEKALSTAR